MNERRVMSTPKHVDIAITGKCNLACQYCFFADEMVAHSDLPTERWLSFFDELGRLGVMTVCLTGGEVFCRPDLFEIIDGIIANRMRYSLLSNGTLITKQTLDQFKIGKRRKRLDSIQISVDGSSAAIHDRSRPKSFNKALRALKILKEAGFPVTVRVTINRFNVDDLENVARLLLDEVGLPSFSTNEAYACGATDRTEGNIILTSDQRQKAMRILLNLSERYNRRILAQAGPLILAQELKMMDEMLACGQYTHPGRGTLSACGGVFSQLGILHDGTIVPCHNLSNFHLGKIGIDELKEIWKNHPIMISLRKRSNIPLDTIEFCHECKYISFCTGGCPGGAVYAYNNFNNIDPRTCYRIVNCKESTPIFNSNHDNTQLK